MTISEYSDPSAVTSYFTSIAQASTLVLCSTLVDPAWTISQVNLDKLFEVPLNNVPGSIGGDFSQTTVSGRSALHIETASIPATVVPGTGTCVALHDGSKVIKVFSVPDIVLSTSEVFNVPPFNIIF